MPYSPNNILQRARSISGQFVDHIEDCAECVFDFSDLNDPYANPDNRVYLWFVESFLEDYEGDGLAFRVAITRYILERWRSRLKGYQPYHQTGYIIYIYETLAPKLDVLIPGSGVLSGQQNLIPTLEEYWQPYTRIPWRDRFEARGIRDEVRRTLEALKKENGSISHGTAQRLGITRAQLRRNIMSWEIEDDVNGIRKHFRRKPAHFPRETWWQYIAKLRAWLEVWPKDY